jgi:ATP-binding cassette subfamily C (CFTR/MRP) protein 1
LIFYLLSMASISDRDCASVDNTFGPYAGAGCRGGFDFTLLFEDSILSITPIALLICVAPFRLLSLCRKETKVKKSLLLPAKLVWLLLESLVDVVLTPPQQIAWTFLAAFDLGLLVLWVQHARFKNKAAIASAVLSLLGAIVLCLLSYFEHLKSVRTSLLLNIYLLVTVVFDAARSRSYSLDSDLGVVSVLFTTRVGVKLFLAIFEARGKRSLLLPDYANCPPEATSGVYNRALFWWQHALFKKGFSNVISVDDLFQLDKHLRSDYLHSSIRSAWEKGRSSRPRIIDSDTD